MRYLHRACLATEGFHLVEPFRDGGPATAVAADMVDVLYGIDFDALCMKT
jgi:hypothetical protein